jgi:hypothetical protein
LFGGLPLPAIDPLNLGEQHVIRWFRALAGHIHWLCEPPF